MAREGEEKLNLDRSFQENLFSVCLIWRDFKFQNFKFKADDTFVYFCLNKPFQA